jgi:hypothetical protein
MHDLQLGSRRTTNLNCEHISREGCVALSNLKKSHSLLRLFDDSRNLIEVRYSSAELL